VICFTPYWQAPEVAAYLPHGDVIDRTVFSWYGYATAYNRAVVELPNYPHADLCRPSAKGDDQDRGGYFPVTEGARPVTRPIRTLHEAARRGNASDIRRMLSNGDVNALDGVDMTSLAWALARDNKVAVELLLQAGANPWTSGARGQDAVLFAALLGRRSYFERMEPLPGRPFSRWPAGHLSGAASGGDAAIIARMLAQPHERLRLELLFRPLPAAAALEPFLRRAPDLATALLWKAAEHPAHRADLVSLALNHGAHPDAVGSVGQYGTVLGAFANGISPASVKIVNLLLKAGANPNLLSHRERPIWIAVGTLKQGGRFSEVDGRATAIFRKLIEAGADINLPDDQGVPPAWLLFFPHRWDHEKLDAGFVTPALIEMLVQNGLDLNAPWQGKRILPLVEAQGGANSELALALRRLGARR
jgi:hypothetical protein